MAVSVAVPEVLTRVRDLVAPALKGAIELLALELQGPAAYHLGWVDERGGATTSDSGKGLRPALAILSAEAVGAKSSAGVPGAVAIELVHNYSLIHDDVMDNDRERRHRLTVWAVFGVAQAIVVGDALAALAQQVVLEPGLLVIGGERLAGERAAVCLAEANAKMIAGQARDISFECRDRVSFEECLAMEEGKTGALLGCAASIGAILAGGALDTVRALDRFGLELGIAFQAVDDLLGIWGDPKTTGKPTWSDIRQHKKSLPIAAALSSNEPGGEELAELLATGELHEEQIERAGELVERLGGREITAGLAEDRLERALSALEEAKIEESAHQSFVDIAHFVVERQY